MLESVRPFPHFTGPHSSMRIPLITKTLSLLSVAIVSAGCLPAGAIDRWSISNVSLVPKGENLRTFQANVKNKATSEVFTISNELTLTSIDEYFVFKDHLIVLGEAGHAQEVDIFDLPGRRRTDWFYCYYPQRISDSLLTYVEWSPSAIAGGEPFDVVLLYDLEMSPAENRPGADARLGLIPAVDRSVPIRVGTPIFPEANARDRSYQNVVTEGGYAPLVVAHTFALVRARQLAFVCAEGVDAPHLRNYLVVVDLSSNIQASRFRKLEIPRDQLKKPGVNPDFIVVNGVEVVSDGVIRLYIPESDYGISSVVMEVPNV